MKRVVKMVVVMLVCLCSMTVYGVNRPACVVIGDVPLEGASSEIFQSEWVTYAPARLLAEALGIEIVWDGGVVLRLPTGNLLAVPQTELKVQGGRSYIPVKYGAQLSAMTVVTNAEGNIVRLKNGQEQLSDEEIFKQCKMLLEERRPKGRKVYLTFDDGPNTYTNQLLDLLAAYDMKATFFMLDGQMKKYPSVVQRMVDEGHGVALHGVSHDKAKFYQSAASPVGEMNAANKTLHAITSQTTKLVRMPYGSVPYLTNGQMQALQSQGYKVWDWQVDSRDWANKDGKKTYDSVVNDLERNKGNGQVILFHDSKATVETIGYLTKWLVEHGYTSAALAPNQTPYTFKK
ncbi:MAG: polysaccharide deacetylase family protein [Cellulosilyticaceae bacterium]